MADEPQQHCQALCAMFAIVYDKDAAFDKWAVPARLAGFITGDNGWRIGL